MKKIVLATAMIVALGASSVSANDTMSEFSLGYSYIDLGYGITGNGGVVGYDFALPLDGENMPFSGLDVGFGFNVDAYSVNSSDSTYKKSVGGANGDLTIGYNFLNNKMKVQGGVGYQYLSVESNLYLTGVQYFGSVRYKITDAFGVEAIYTGASLSPSVGDGTINESKVGFNLTFSR